MALLEPCVASLLQSIVMGMVLRFARMVEHVLVTWSSMVLKGEFKFLSRTRSLHE